MKLRLIIAVFISALLFKFTFAGTNSSRINSSAGEKEETLLSEEVHEQSEKIEGVPVFFDDKELFRIYSNVGLFQRRRELER